MGRWNLSASALALAATTSISGAVGLEATRSSTDGGLSYTFAYTLDSSASSLYLALPSCNSYNLDAAQSMTHPDGQKMDVRELNSSNNFTFSVFENTRTIQVPWFDSEGNKGTIDAPGCDVLPALVCNPRSITVEGTDLNCYEGNVLLSLNPVGSSGFNSVQWATTTSGVTIDDSSTVVTTARFQYSSFVSSVSVQLTLTDENNYSKDCNFSFSVADTVPPTLSGDLSNNYTVSCEDVPVPVTLTASDNCAAETTITAQANFTPSGTATSGTGTYEYVYTAEDEANTTVFTKTVSVVDGVPPTLVGVPELSSASCGEVPAPCEVTATDTCTANSIAVNFEENTETSDNCSYKLIRSWTAIDEDGNENKQEKTIVVTDGEAPFFVGVPEVSSSYASCDSSNNEDDLPLLEVSDLCSTGSELTPIEKTVVSNSGTVNQDNVVEVVYSYTSRDLCGLGASYEHTLNIYDDSPPVISGVDEDKTVEMNSDVNPTSLFCSPVAVDNCTLASDNLSAPLDSSICNSNSCECVYTRRFFASDQYNNQVFAEQNITVKDTTPPKFTGTDTPAAITAECDSIPSFDVNCYDAATGLTWDAVEDVLTNSDGSKKNYTWTCTDSCSLSVTKKTEVTIRDTTPPAFVTVQDNFEMDCSQLTTNEANGSKSVISDSTSLLEFIPTPSIIENCGGTLNDFSATSTYSLNDCRNDNCQIEATYQAVDQSLNESSVTITVTVTDTTPPTLTDYGSGTQTVECSDLASFLLEQPTAEDDCTENSSVGVNEEFLSVRELDANDNTPSCADNTEKSRKWTATDASGNQSTTTRMAYVRDTTPPVFVLSTLPETESFDTCGSEPVFSEQISAIQYSDNCTSTGSITTSNKNELQTITDDCVGKAIYHNEFVITDECGNATTHQWTITTIDITSPTFTTPGALPSYQQFFTEQGFKNPIADDTIQITEACSPDLVDMQYVENTVSSKSTCDYTLSRDWNPQDDCGNAVNSHSVTYVVKDNTPPALNDVVDSTRACLCDDSDCLAIPAVKPTFKDCALSDPNPCNAENLCEEDFTAQVEIINIENENVCTGTYKYKERYYYVDYSQNMSESFTTVTVTDNSPPTLSNVAADVTLECLTDPNPYFITANAEDNCDNNLPAVTGSITSGNTNFGGDLVYTYQIQDDCGNKQSHLTTVTYVDTVPPVMSATDKTVECPALDVSSINMLTHSCTDACTDAHPDFDVDIVHTIVHDAGTDASVEKWLDKYAVTYTCTDGQGLKHSVVNTLTVEDLTPPQFLADDANYTPSLSYSCDNIDFNPTVGYQDTCTATSEIQFDMSSERKDGDSLYEYTIERVYTIVDESGNTTAFDQTATVYDQSPPTLTVVAEDNSYQCAYVDFEDTTGTVTVEDNCSAEDAITVILTETPTMTCIHDGEVVRHWTAYDEAGNESTFVQTVKILNTVPPTLVVKPDSETKEWDEWRDNYTLPTFSAVNDCGDTLTVQSGDDSKTLSNSCPTTYDNTKTIFVVDACGLRTEHSWIQTAIDNTPPGLLFKSDSEDTSLLGGNVYTYTTTYECEGLTTTFPTFTATKSSSDNQHIDFADSLTIDYTNLNDMILDLDVQPEDDCKFLREKWVVTDCANNSVTYTRDENVEDTVPPVLVWPNDTAPVDQTYDCAYEVPADQVAVTATYSDLCSTRATVTIVPDLNPTDKDIFMNKWSYSASDDCGKSVSYEYSITVSDTTPPLYYWGSDGAAAEPADITAEANAVPDRIECKYGDNCLAADQSTRLPCTATTETLSQTTSTSYVLKHCFTMPDQNGANPGQKCYQVDISDNSPPTLENLPDENISVEGTMEWPIPVQAVTCKDDMAASIPVVYNEEETWRHHLAEIRQFNVERTWECTDVDGNIDIFTQTIEVLDKVMSEFNCVPLGTTITCDDTETDAKVEAASALLTNSTEGCSWEPIDAQRTIDSLVEETTAQKCANDYTKVFTYTVYDVVSNSVVQTQTIKVEDATAPVFDADELSAIESGNSASAQDWCNLRAPGVLTAKDACNYETTTVVRTTEVSYPKDGHSTHPDDGGSNYNIKYIYTTEDECGNADTYEYTDIVRDLTPPKMTCGDSRSSHDFCLSSVTVECDGATPPPGPDSYTGDDGSYSNCGALTTEANVVIVTNPSDSAATVQSTTYAGCNDVAHVYTYDVVATDASGNQKSQTHVVNYTDTTPPTVVLVPETETARNAKIACTFDPSLDDYSAYRPYVTCTDACGTCNTVFTENASYDNNSSIISNHAYVTEWEVTWTVTDQCGFESSHVQTLTKVDDTTPPVIDTTEVQSYTVEAHIDNKCGGTYGRCVGLDDKRYCDADNGVCTSDGNFKGTSAFDQIEVLDVTDDCFRNTESVTVTNRLVEISKNDCTAVYTNTWVVNDDSGNQTSHVQTITITDTTPPTFDSSPGPWTFNCEDSAQIDTTAPSASDVATGSGYVVQVEKTPTMLNQCSDNHYIEKYTYVATDKCGLTSTYMTSLTVEDNEDPTYNWHFNESLLEQCAPPTAADLCSQEFEFKDNCATFDCSESVMDYVQETLAYTNKHDYSIKRTWTVYDNSKDSSCANNATKEVVYVVNDTEKANCSAQAHTLNCEDDVPAPNEDDVSCTDNCTAVEELTIVTDGADVTNALSGNEFEVVRSWLITDVAGNETSIKQTFTFEDVTPPTIILPSYENFHYSVHDYLPILDGNNRYYADCNITEMETDFETFIEANVDDNCDAAITVDYNFSMASPMQQCSSADIVNKVKTVTASDDNGNTSTKTVNLVSQDYSPPTFTSTEITLNRAVDKFYLSATKQENDKKLSGPGVLVLTGVNAEDCASNANDYTEKRFSYNADTSSCEILVDGTQAWTTSTSTGSYIVTIGSEVDNLSGEELVGGQTSWESLSESIAFKWTDELVKAPHFTTDDCDTQVHVDVTMQQIYALSDTCGLQRTYTYVATDDCGNTATQTGMRMAVDNTPPKLIGVPAPQFDNQCPSIDDEAQSSAFTVTADDNNDVFTDATVTHSSRTNTCDNSFTVDYTWRAEDLCGNVTTSVVKFTHTDNSPPLIEHAQGSGITLECSDTFNYMKAVSKDANCGGEQHIGTDDAFGNVYYDNSLLGSTYTSLVDVQVGTGLTEFTLENRYSDTDDCGNSSSYVQTLTVVDTTPPQFTSSTLPESEIDVQCTSDDNSAWPEATDNCEFNGDVTRTTEISNEMCTHREKRVHTWQVSDQAGNIATYKQTVNIFDNTPPAFDAFTTEATWECSSKGSHPVPTYSDVCSGDIIYVAVPEKPTPACENNYYESTLYTITDVCGNQTTATFSALIEDTTAPTFDITPSDTTVSIENIATSWPGEISASDNCSGSTNVVFTENISNVVCPHTFTLNRKWETDDCTSANATSVTQTVDVRDTAPPVITPTNSNPISTVDSMEYGTKVSAYDIIDSFDFEITDNSNGDIVITHTENITANSNMDGKVGCAMTVEYTLEAVDECANSASYVFTVQVEDNTPPEFNDYPDDMQIEIDESIPACTLTVVNDCKAITPSYSQETVNGNIERTWTATDGVNSTSYTQTIFISDTSPPRFTHLPEDATVECDCTAKLDTAAKVAAVDNDASNSTPTVQYSSDTFADSGNNYRIVHTWTTSDLANNSNSYSQTITVLDTTPPTLINLDDPQGTLPEVDKKSDCSVFIPELQIDAEDACDASVVAVPNINSTKLDEAPCGTYTITREYSAVDENGHSSSWVQTVNIADEKAPTCDSCSEEICLYPNNKTITFSKDELFNDRVKDDCSGVSVQLLSCVDEYGDDANCVVNGDNVTITGTRVNDEDTTYYVQATGTDGCSQQANFFRSVKVYDVATTLTKNCLEPKN